MSKIIAVIFHPLLLALYCSIMVLCDGVYSGLSSYTVARVINTMVVYTIFFPMTVVALFHFLGRTDFQMSERRMRPVPLVCVGLFIILSLVVVNCHNTPRPLVGILFGEGVLTVLLGLCSIAYRVSLHGAGVGALFAFVCTVGLLYNQSFALEAAFCFVMSGAVGWARLYDNAHSPMQMLSGFCLGFIVIAVVEYLTISHILFE